ncbi:MAG: DNA-binding protein [Steroidobacteraceae bacterium]
MARRKNRSTAAMSSQARYRLAVAYLNSLLEDAGAEELAAALGRIAHFCGGPRLADKVELSADSLYRTLCRRGNPELRSATALLKAMGMRLVLEPFPAAYPASRRRVSETPRHGTCVDSPAGRLQRDSHG